MNSHEEGGTHKTLLGHIEDLRWTLIKSGGVLLASMVLCFCFRGWLAAMLERPLRTAAPDQSLQSLGVADSFTVSMELAFYAGIVLAFPLILYFVAQFILPALTRAESRVLLPVVVVGFFLFLAGVMFAYFAILPLALGFFYADATQVMGWKTMWTVREYYTFASTLTLSFGVAFQLPLVVVALVKLGILNYAMLARTRRYAVMIIAIVSVLLTPPDVFTLFLMGVPLYLLYEACIAIAWFLNRKSSKNQTIGARTE